MNSVKRRLESGSGLAVRQHRTIGSGRSRSSSNSVETPVKRVLLLAALGVGREWGRNGSRSRDGQDVIGYEQVGTKVISRCVDPQCRFGGRSRLPVHVVDEDIYTVRPSIIIGTINSQ